jgi:hypothetical protein
MWLSAALLFFLGPILSSGLRPLQSNHRSCHRSTQDANHPWLDFFSPCISLSSRFCLHAPQAHAPGGSPRYSTEAMLRIRDGFSDTLRTQSTGLIALLALLLACTQDESHPTASESVSHAPAHQPSPVVARQDSPYLAFGSGSLPTHRNILEIASDGRRILGQGQPVPPRSSARQLFTAVFVDSHGHESPLPIHGLLQDARFALPPSQLVALLDDRDELVVWNTQTGWTRRIDDQVFPGFGFSHSASTLVYAKGFAPELEAFRADLPDGIAEQLTSGGVPVWGFAFSPDDSRIVYVDAPDGFPCLTVMPARGGTRERFTNRTLGPQDLRAGKPLAPFPDGRRPPLWLNDTVYVEDSNGIHAINAFGNVVRSHPGGHDLHRSISGTAALFRDGTVVRQVGP